MSSLQLATTPVQTTATRVLARSRSRSMMAASLQSQGVTVVVAALVLALVAAGCFLALTLSLASSQASRTSQVGPRAVEPSTPDTELFVPRQRTVRVESVVVTDPGPGAEWGRWGRTGERPRRALPPARDRVL